MAAAAATTKNEIIIFAEDFTTKTPRHQVLKTVCSCWLLVVSGWLLVERFVGSCILFLCLCAFIFI